MEYGLWSLAGFRGTDALSAPNGEAVRLLPPANDNVSERCMGWLPRMVGCVEDAPARELATIGPTLSRA